MTKKEEFFFFFWGKSEGKIIRRVLTLIHIYIYVYIVRLEIKSRINNFMEDHDTQNSGTCVR